MRIKARNNRFIIGIDPDVDMSGIATLDVDKRELWADTLPFPQLIDFCKELAHQCKENGKELTICVENSWTSTHNWHLLEGKRKEYSAQIGYKVGANHAVGKLIIEMLEHENLTVTEKRPLAKIWNTKDGKISHDKLINLLECSGISTSIKRTNPEKRDAALLAIDESGIPMRIK